MYFKIKATFFTLVLLI